MRGLWRPTTLYLVLVLGLDATLLARGDALSAPGAAFLVLPLILFLFLAFIVALGVLPAGRFVAGLRDADPHVEILKDEIGWLGDRHMRVRTDAGEWSIESEGGKQRHLEVKPPGARRAVRVQGNPRQRGREAAPLARSPLKEFEAAMEPTHRADAPVDAESAGTYRPRLATALALLGVAGFVGATWALSAAPSGVETMGWELLRWTALGAGALIAFIAGAALSWKRWGEKLHEGGRRGGSATLLVGIACALLTFGAGLLGGSLVASQPWTVPVGLALLAAGVLELGLLAATLRGPLVRAALTLGCAAAGAASLLLPSPLLTWPVLALTLLALFQAWTSAAPTQPAE